jgi:hypothetical protein
MLLDVAAHSRAPSYARHDGCPVEFDFTKRDDIAIVLKVSYEAVMYLVLPSTVRFVFLSLDRGALCVSRHQTDRRSLWWEERCTVGGELVYHVCRHSDTLGRGGVWFAR